MKSFENFDTGLTFLSRAPSLCTLLKFAERFQKKLTTLNGNKQKPMPAALEQRNLNAAAVHVTKQAIAI